jgi:hypothetical protein
MDKVSKIFIYGDGAGWIVKCSDVFSDAIQVLDTFHYKKRIKRLVAGEVCAPYGHNTDSHLKPYRKANQ